MFKFILYVLNQQTALGSKDATTDTAHVRALRRTIEQTIDRNSRDERAGLSAQGKFQTYWEPEAAHAAAHAGHLKLRIAALTCFALAPGKAHETWQKRLQRVHPISGTLLR